MGIALTIGIMFVFFGIIICMTEKGPYTFLDDIHPATYIVMGGGSANQLPGSFPVGARVTK